MSYWDSAICEANGINLHYTRTGGNKPPLILLHGLMTNGMCWSGLAHVLEKEYDVIMPDARGHGNSSVPDFGYRYEDHAKDVADQHRRMLNMSLDEVVADARNRHPDRSEEILELFARARLETSMAAFDVLTPPNPDYKMLVSEIDVPSLIVFGDRGVVSSVVAEELQCLNPRFQAEQIRDAGHSVHLDQPERFASVVRTFIRSIGGMA